MRSRLTPPCIFSPCAVATITVRRLKVLETSYAEEDYAIGMNKDNTALVEAVNAALEDLKADGTLQSIVDKYITAD